MPSLKVHEEFSLEKYGKKFTELHKWMDEPARKHGPSHRWVRHDPDKTPQEARELFGKNADKACIDHITLDRIDERSKDEKTELISLRLSKTLNDRLMEYSLFVDVTKSEIIREFIKEGLIKHAHIGMLKRWQISRKYVNDFMEHRRKWVCEKCGYNKDVKIYHIDRDVTNTSPDNIVFLCKFCVNKLDRFMRKYDPQEKFAAWFFFVD